MNDWQEQSSVLAKEFRFVDFKQALAFVTAVGDIAERLQHHPDITIHDYNCVTVSTTTHDAGTTITSKDRALTAAIDTLYT